jgi:hypothetical protein
MLSICYSENSGITTGREVVETLHWRESSTRMGLDRYELVTRGFQVFLLDKWTGHTEILEAINEQEFCWRPIVDQKTQQALQGAQPLPRGEGSDAKTYAIETNDPLLVNTETEIVPRPARVIREKQSAKKRATTDAES